MLSTLLLIGAGLLLFGAGFGLGLYVNVTAPLMPDNYDTDESLSISR